MILVIFAIALADPKEGGGPDPAPWKFTSDYRVP